MATEPIITIRPHKRTPPIAMNALLSDAAKRSVEGLAAEAYRLGYRGTNGGDVAKKLMLYLVSQLPDIVADERDELLEEIAAQSWRWGGTDMSRAKMGDREPCQRIFRARNPDRGVRKRGE